MRITLFSPAILALLVAAGVSSAAAQERVARTPSAAVQTAPVNVSPAEAAVQNAAGAGKYLFLFFWRDKTPQTDSAWNTTRSAVEKMSEWATLTPIQVADSAEKPLVDRFGVSRSPMPLVLAVAPCGAVTKAFTGKFDQEQLAAARVSPCTELCLKGLQQRKLVFLCVQDAAAQGNRAVIPPGVEQFRADAQYARFTEVVLVRAGDPSEAAFLKSLQVDPQAAQPVSVLLAPPGSLVGKFDASATKQQIAAKLAAAQSGCCPGGQCGPNGCGPRK